MPTPTMVIWVCCGSDSNQPRLAGAADAGAGAACLVSSPAAAGEGEAGAPISGTPLLLLLGVLAAAGFSWASPSPPAAAAALRAILDGVRASTNAAGARRLIASCAWVLLAMPICLWLWLRQCMVAGAFLGTAVCLPRSCVLSTKCGGAKNGFN